MPISWRRENDGFIMTHNLKTETFSQKIERSGRVIVLPPTPLFSFVIFHLKFKKKKSPYFSEVMALWKFGYLNLSARYLENYLS